ncbi:adenylate isopentenyltransferase 8, chloroplastic-like [Phragmites australis]|uniref:adenylate isopentenyltransferase 8, chloroplastic-like n=1 Tax=Phragmites australis TaxID=29695 RepID=UPI002D7982C0|nr:adenylate isopentenyltransferase 8, chloroplastic-like [Phragmites australis]
MLANRLVVIMGAIGIEKTKLSIDVAKVIGDEVLNVDKMQAYAGFDIATNKVSFLSRCGIPHHLLVVIPFTVDDFPISLFLSLATMAVNCIVRRGRMPIVVGGSNSLIHGLLVDYFDSSLVKPFVIADYCMSLSFQSCIIWIHPNEVILNEYLNCHVIEIGLVEEVKEYFDAHNNYVGGHWSSKGNRRIRAR